VELLAVQPPGRAARSAEPPIPRAADLAAAALPALAPRLAGPVPWLLIGHSAGAWVGYEFALAAARAGLPPPVRALLSAMLPPDTPPEQRPWRKSAGLSTADLQAECRAWGMAPAALSPAVWPAFEPLIRADFQLFDEYEWGGWRSVEEGGGGRLACPLTVFAGTGDGRCPAPALAGWSRFAPAFELVSVDGPHLWPLDRGCKPRWLAAIAARAAADLGLPGPAEGWSGGGGGGTSA
jgi:medium-chain acyl-[acyl-carrier-protein] hydrolase